MQKKGMMVDASFVEVPRQRNTRDENDQIKNDQIPDDWKDNVAKLRQKDTEARWTEKNGEDHYGYKNHVNVDVKHKLIREFTVTSANVHDSQVIADLIDKDNSKQAIWGDSAYRSTEIEKKLEKKSIQSNIHRKAYRNKPLSKFQEELNHKKSKIRARVEHVFASIDRMIGRTIKCIGQRRAASRICITNLVYNMNRYTYLSKAR